MGEDEGQEEGNSDDRPRQAISRHALYPVGVPSIDGGQSTKIKYIHMYKSFLI